MTDDEAKKTVQEAVWAGAGRLVIMAVVFGAGFFVGWMLYARGDLGAPALRAYKEKADATHLEMKNKIVDIEGRLTKYQGDITKLQKDLGDCRTKAAAAAAAGTAAPR